VAVTAHSAAADRMRVLAAGFRQHVSKPVEAAELLVVVASVVSRANGAEESGS
jgi:DNA-binding response OmpR family regulator